MKKLALLVCLILLLCSFFTGCDKGNPTDSGTPGGTKDYASAISTGDYEAALDAILRGDANSEDAEKFLVVPTEIACVDRYGEYTVKFTYDDNGLLTTFEKLKENMPEKYVLTYNSSRLITNITHYKGKNDSDPAVYTYTYDDKGNMLIDDSAYNSNRRFTITYTYDENGRILTATETTKEYKENPVELVYNYTYDENGNLLSRLRACEDDGIRFYRGMVYTYDSQNRMITEHELQGQGEVTNKYTYAYDENGRKTIKRWESVTDDDWWIEELYAYDSNGTQYVKTYSDGGDLEAYVYSYEFDKNGRLTKKTYTERDDKETRVSTYDTAGNIINIHRTKEDGSVDETYTYAFDKYGNRTKESFAKNGTTAYSYDVKYEVKYYENGAPELPKYIREFKNATSIYSFL